MAGIAAAAMATAPPRRAPRWRRITAAALWVLLAVATYAAVCRLLGALWMGSAANAACIAACRAYGEDSRVKAVAREFRGVAFVAVGFFFFGFCLAVVLDMMLRRPRASRKGEAREISGDEGTMVPAAQGRDPESTRARRGVNDRVNRPVIVVVFVVMAVGLLVVLERAKGSMLLDIVSFVISLMFFFVIVPNYAIQVTGGAKGLRNIGIMTHVSFKALGYAIHGCRGDFTWPSPMMR